MGKDHNAEGQKDFEKCGGQASDPVTEIFHPSYDPPSDPKGKEEYDSGWNNAKKQH
jgi:hypothetical protein